MNLVLRDATPDDARVILRFVRELAEYEREKDAVLLEPDDVRAHLMEDPPAFECLVAELDGRPAGMALFFSTFSTWVGRGIHLEDLYVAPEFRGRGVGRALMAALAARALERGARRLEWAVLDWNEPALRFYDRLGARRHEGWLRYRVTEDELSGLARAWAQPGRR